MKKYIATQVVLARPMTRGEYNEYRMWEVPADEDPADHGYLIETLDTDKSNHVEHDGYISWLPEGMFEAAFRPAQEMTFGQAIEALKKEARVARQGWNGNPRNDHGRWHQGRTRH